MACGAASTSVRVPLAPGGDNGSSCCSALAAPSISAWLANVTRAAEEVDWSGRLPSAGVRATSVVPHGSTRSGTLSTTAISDSSAPLARAVFGTGTAAEPMAIGGEGAGRATLVRRVAGEGAAREARCLPPPAFGAARPRSLQSNPWIVPRRPDRGLYVMSKPKDEIGDRLGHKRADSIGKLLLLVD